MNTLHSLFSWILDASLRASLLAGAVLCFQAALRGHLSARWRYAMWLPVLLVLVLPVLPASRWSVETLFAPRPAPTLAMVSVQPMVVASVAPSTDAIIAESAPLELLPLVWVAGAALSLGIGFGSYLRAMRRFRRQATKPSAQLLAMVRELSASTGLGRPPQVWMAEAIESPAVAGLLRRVLLLPANVQQAFTHDELNLVLKHELMHLKRRDLPMNALVCVLQAMHWFNPVFWFVAARVREDRESACDAQVLAADQRDCRQDYGHALLKAQTAFSPRGFSLGFVGFFGGERAMRSRIEAIARHRRMNPLMGLIAAALMGLLCLGGATRAELPVGVEIGQVSFPNKDVIHITHVQRDAQFLTVHGDYELVSQDAATLALYITAIDKEHAKSKTDPRQQIEVKKGTGTFTLTHPDPYPGMPHVTFYSLWTKAGGGKPFGGIYFGTKEEAERSKKMTLNYTSGLSASSSASGLPIEAKLKHLILPRASFREASVEEVVEFLRLKSRDLDVDETDAKRKGVNILIKPPASQPASKITLDLSQVSLFEVLRYTVALAGCELHLEPYAAIVTSKGEAIKAASTASKSSAETGSKLVLDQMVCSEATLSEAVEFIRSKSREIDPKKQGVNIVLKPEAQASPAKITLSLKSVPVDEALRYCAELSGMKLEANGTVFIIGPAGSK